MVNTGRAYDERVKVFSKIGELIGTARFAGQARKSQRGGLWAWGGHLYDTSYDVRRAWGSREIELVLEDGAVGEAVVTLVKMGSHSSRIELLGKGIPPRE